MEIKAGQVLWLRLPFGKTDEVSKVFHPYLVLEVNEFGFGLLELGQMDSENGRAWELLQGKKIPVDNLNPQETVIYEASYLQTDRKIQIEYFDELKQYLDTEDTLSSEKFRKVVNSYYNKRQKYGSDNFRDMYFTKAEVLSFNAIEEWNVAQKRRYAVHKISFSE